VAESEQEKALTAPMPQLLRVVVGPVAFGADLLIRYALVHHACSTGQHYWFHAISACSLLIVLLAAFGAWRQYTMVLSAADEGGSRLDRTHFASLTAVLLNLGCALLIIANAIPAFLLNPCD
jgi:hypothetical protein